MSMKVVAMASLIVVLSAAVAHAEEEAACPPEVTEEACPPEEEACPPEEAAVSPKPTVTTVSYSLPAVPGVDPATLVDEPINSYLDLAPRNAFEIGFQGGYAQQFGDLANGVNISDVADAGGEVALDLGWRVNPMAMVGISGRFNEQFVDDQFSDGADMNIRGGSVGIQGTVYLAPYALTNPYVTMGAGYRTYWIDPEGPEDSTVFHGVELARLQLGLDFRMARDFSLGPNAGAGLDMMLAEHGGNQEPGEDTLIEDPGPSAFVFAGVAGRFEIGGSRVSKGVYYGKYPYTREVTASR